MSAAGFGSICTGGESAPGWSRSTSPRSTGSSRSRSHARAASDRRAQVVELAEWASWRWAGPLSVFLGSASPPRVVRQLPSAGGASRERPDSPGGGAVALVDAALAAPGPGGAPIGARARREPGRARDPAPDRARGRPRTRPFSSEGRAGRGAHRRGRPTGRTVARRMGGRGERRRGHGRDPSRGVGAAAPHRRRRGARCARRVLPRTASPHLVRGRTWCSSALGASRRRLFSSPRARRS